MRDCPSELSGTHQPGLVRQEKVAVQPVLVHGGHVSHFSRLFVIYVVSISLCVFFKILDDNKFNKMFQDKTQQMCSVTLLGCKFTNSVYNNYFAIIFMYLEIVM